MPSIFYVGIKGVIVNNNKVLLLKSKSKIDDGQFWDLPGGRMESNETIQEALIRELIEELPGSPILPYII
ncbi:MAG TPA: NUDIX domain-containing protein [Candidatus Babeliales bacterium]|nr:NUDIX domain-containing protein [Candidatus Babeliales bacterium]